MKNARSSPSKGGQLPPPVCFFAFMGRITLFLFWPIYAFFLCTFPLLVRFKWNLPGNDLMKDPPLAGPQVVVPVVRLTGTFSPPSRFLREVDTLCSIRRNSSLHGFLRFPRKLFSFASSWLPPLPGLRNLLRIPEAEDPQGIVRGPSCFFSGIPYFSRSP